MMQQEQSQSEMIEQMNQNIQHHLMQNRSILKISLNNGQNLLTDLRQLYKQKFDTFKLIEIKKYQQPQRMIVQRQRRPHEEKINIITQISQKGKQASLKTKNKDVIMVGGKTGAGKSTFISYLLKLIIILYNNHLKIQEMKGFQVGHGGVNSKTNQVNVAQINSKYFVDTPGFFDARGILYRIGHGIGFIQAIHNAKSIKFLLLIHQTTILGDGKSQSLIDLIKQFNDYVKNEDLRQYYLSTNVIITHSTKPIQQIIQRISTIITEPKENIIQDKNDRQNVDKFLKALKFKLQELKITEHIRLNQKQIQNIKSEKNLQISSKKIKQEQSGSKSTSKFQNKQIISNCESAEPSPSKSSYFNLGFFNIFSKSEKKQQHNQRHKNSFKRDHQQIQPINIQINENKLREHQITIREKQLQLINLENSNKDILKLNSLSFCPIQKLLTPIYAQEIFKILQKCPAISNTKNKFQIILKNQKKTESQNILLNILKNLSQSLKYQKWEQASQQLKLIYYFNKHLKTNAIEFWKRQAEQYFIKAITSFFDRFKILNNIFQKHQTLTLQKMQIVRNDINNIKRLQIIFQEHAVLQGQNTSFELISSSLKGKVQAEITLLIKNIQDLSFLKNQIISFSNLQIIYQVLGSDTEFKQIKNQYEELTHSFFTKLLDYKQQSLKLIVNGQYDEKITLILTFYKNTEQVVNHLFGFNLKKIYDQLIKLINNSLEYRFSQKFNQLREKQFKRINIIQQIKKPYEDFFKIKKNKTLINHIGKQSFDKCQKQANKFIQSLCSICFTLINQYRQNKNYEHIEKPFSKLIQLRQINKKTVKYTQQKYSICMVQFISIFEQFKQQKIINNIKSLFTERLTLKEFDGIVKGLQLDFKKIKAIDWFSKHIQKFKDHNIKQLIAKSLKQLIQKYGILSQNDYDREFIASKDNLLKISYPNFSTQSSMQDTNNSHYSFKINYFKKTNNILKIVSILKNLGFQLKQSYDKIQNSIQLLVKKSCQQLQGIINSKNNMDNQVKQVIIKITVLKYIENGPSKLIDDTFSKICIKMKQFLQQSQRKLNQQNIQNHQNIIKALNQISQLQSSLKYKFFQNLQEGQESIYSRIKLILKSKFDEFYKKIQKDLISNNLSQCDKKLQTLSKYQQFAVINQYLSNNLQTQYKDKTTKLLSKNSQIPQEFKKKINYQQLSDLITEVKIINQKCDQNLKTQINKIIKRRINDLYQSVLSVLSKQKQYKYKIQQLQKLKNQLKDFQSYKSLYPYLLPFNVDQKYDQLIEKLNEKILQMKKEIQDLIKQNHYQNIKQKVQIFKNFCSKLKQYISQNNISQIFDGSGNKIQQQHKQKLNTYSNTFDLNDSQKNLQKLEILKRYDNENPNTSYSKNFQNKLKQSIITRLNLIQDQIPSIQDYRKIIKTRKKLKDIQSDNYYLFQTQYFKDLKNIYSLIKDKINSRNSIYQNFQSFTRENLQFLRQNDDNQYIKTCKTIKAKIQFNKIKISQRISSEIYQNLFDQLKQMKQNNELLKFTQFIKIYDQNTQYITQIQYTILNQWYKYFHEVNRKIDNISIERQYIISFQLFFNLSKCINQQSQDVKTKLNQIHQKIVNKINMIIPQRNNKQLIEQLYQELQITQKYKKFFDVLIKQKQWLENDLLQKIRCNNKKDIQQKINQQQKNLLNKIKQLWKDNKLIQIKNTFSNIKRTNCDETFRIKYISQISNILKISGENIKNQLDKKSLNMIQYKQLNNQIHKIKNAEREFTIFKDILPLKSIYISIQQELLKKLNNCLSQAKQKINNQQVDRTQQVIKQLIELKQWEHKLPILRQFVIQKIKQIFGQIHSIKKNQGINLIHSALMEKSRKTPQDQHNHYCNSILNQFKNQLLIPRPFIKSLDVKSSIQKIEGPNKTKLEQCYRNYQIEHTQKQKTYIIHSTKQRISQNLLNLKGQIISYSQKCQNQDLLTFIPILLARIFVYYSLSKHGNAYYSSLQRPTDQLYQYLFLPHSNQILSILSFLGCCEQEKLIDMSRWSKKIMIKNLPNHLMQIKTGQGKSIILGALSIILGLLGYKVYCVCYSPYLSERDYKSFKQCFDDFGIDKNIKYGTFNSILQSFINKKGNVRTMVDKLFKSQKPIVQQMIDQTIYKGNILLIDQVDTFFKKQFYGNSYQPCTVIKNQNMRKIIRYLYKNRNLNSQNLIQSMKEQISYKKIIQDYKDCSKQIQNQFNIMISDLNLLSKKINQKLYEIKEDKKMIGYKQQDDISYNISDGYVTMFLYLYHEGNEEIQKNSFDDILGISISCGVYSYAQVVHKFDKIFGVSGTLSNINEFQNKILENFDIKVKTFTPSAYGNSNLIQLPIKIQKNSQAHYQAIINSLNDIMQKKSPALVFFRNQREVLKFKDQIDHFQSQSISVKLLTQNSPDKDFCVAQATAPKSITLITSSFGRGTDFVAIDQIFKDHGVFVIQTYLPLQVSQQIQTKGRTARQSKKGCYQMIVNQQQLQKQYGITQQMIQKAGQSENSSIKQLFDKKRNQLVNIINRNRQKKVIFSKKKHQYSYQKLNQIIAKKITREDSFFYVRGQCVKIAILIDSTGSMDDTLNAVKNKVMNMIKELSAKHPQQFQIQIMFYYGSNAYNSQNDEDSEDVWCYSNQLHYSPWSNDIQILSKFLRTSKPSGGCSDQAIEVALHHLLKSNQQVGVQKAILIGDDGRKGLLNHQLTYFIHPKDKQRYQKDPTIDFNKPLILKLQDLIRQLKDKQISVDTYPIGNANLMKKTCEQISSATNGKSKAFDPTKDNLAQQIQSIIRDSFMMKR